MTAEIPPVSSAGKSLSEGVIHHFGRNAASAGRVVVWLLSGLLLIGAARAQLVGYTGPRGIYTVKVPGASQPDQPVRTYLGIQLLPDAKFMGIVRAVSANTVSFQNTDSHSAFSTPDRQSYLHVIQGAGRGFIADITEFRNADLLCAEDLTPWIQPGNLVYLRPHSSLADILGAANPFNLGSGPDAATADNVVIWDPASQQERVYYFDSNDSRWEEAGIDNDAGNAVFRFPYGFYIVRRSPGTLRIVLSGDSGVSPELAVHPVLLPVRPGANVFSLPINLTGSLGAIVQTDGAFPVISGPNAKLADILTFEEPTTGNQRGPFYHLSRNDVSGWREVGVNDSSAPLEPLDFLSTLILWRNGNAGRVRVEGSMEPPTVPRPPLPADPEPGEAPLTVVFPMRQVFPPYVRLTVEVSQDLQNWSDYAIASYQNSVATFQLPAGQTRAFYRLKVSLDF